MIGTSGKPIIEINSNHIYFICTEDQARKLDAIWVKSRNAWRLPNTLGALRELHKAGYDVMEYGKLKAEAKEKLLRKKNPEIVPMYDKRLRPYQLEDIYFLSSLPHVGVFNEQRTGKSVSALKTLETEGRKKNLIVCPASLVLNWANEISKFTTNTPFPVSGNKAKRMKIYSEFKNAAEGYLIMSKEVLRADVEILETL